MPGTRSDGETVDWLSSRFGRVRVRGEQSQQMPDLLSRERLLIRRHADEAALTKYWLSTLPANIGFRQFVDVAKLRWRIERDYPEFSEEVELGHHEWPRVAWLRSSRQDVHRSVREDDSPSRPGSPLRPERYIPNSITAMRVSSITPLIRALPRCHFAAATSQQICD
jgi:hypothetical protein